MSDFFKNPPNDIELEKNVLGAILLSGYHLDDFMGKITTKLFNDPKNIEICAAINELKAINSPIDIITVVRHLRNSGKIQAVGGAAYISSLTDRIVSTSNFEYNLKILQQIQMRRDVIHACTEAITSAYDDCVDPLSTVSLLGELFDGKLDEFCDRKEASSAELVTETIANIIRKKYDKTVGIYTGFSRLDFKLGGFSNSKLYILGARPAMGKTALALSFAYNAAKQGKNVLFLSLEMDNEEIMKRILSIHTGVGVSEMDTLAISDAQIEQLKAAKEQIKQLSIHFDDSPYCTLSHIRARCKKLQKKGLLDIVFIDYLQLMRSENTRKNMSQNDLIGDLSKGLKGLAKELKIPIIALSQLSREVEKRSDKEPQLSDLRESGSIEQDADCVMFLWRPEYYDTTEYVKTALGDLHPAGIACIKIAKNRQGATFLTHLNFEHQLTRFSELSENRTMQNFYGQKDF